MKESIFNKGISLESDTYYKATENRYDIYLADCIKSENEKYFSYTRKKFAEHYIGFFLKDLKNVTLDFQGATIVFHGRIVPFILDNCENIKLINFQIDYDRPFYTQARVFECNSKQMKIKIDPGFDYRVEDGYLYAVGDSWEKKLNRNDCLLWLFDRTGKKEYPIILSLFGPEIFPNENPPMPIGQIFVEQEDEYLILNGDFPQSWECNDGNNSLVFTHEVRDKCTITFVDCKNIYIENFILLYGAAYALMGMHSENIYIDNFSLYMDYEGNGRLVTNNADAVHLFNCKGDFVLKNSHMEGMLDDTVNIHNNYLIVESVQNKTLICKSRTATADLLCPLFERGDNIAIYRGKTQELKNTYKIENVILDKEKNLFRYELNDVLVGIEQGDVIENLSGHPIVLIENCTFGRFRGTMRLQSRNKTIVRNCEFRNKGKSIIFTGDTTYWFESGPVNNFLFEGCKFYYTEMGPRICFYGDVEFTSVEPFYHKNITVQNCYFDCGIIASLNHVDGFTFKNNMSNGVMRLSVQNSDNIIFDQNLVVEYK
ncbi:MAG: hypothetical protein J6C23_04210 [Clostridia bacterium]|nr:hypothetical protein [Clostridia bacterium]